MTRFVGKRMPSQAPKSKLPRPRSASGGVEPRSEGVAGFGIVIPARFGAARLPGKPLRLVCGRPLIAHVYENALRARADFTWVATDDDRIADVVRRLGGEVVLTSSEHRSGTERLAEVVEKCKLSDETVVVNVQGDEPLLAPELVHAVVQSLRERPEAALSTVASVLIRPKDIFDPNVVKVVVDHAGYAQYFSRAAIPWVRDEFPLAAELDSVPLELPALYRHWGIYAYRAKTLTHLRALAPSPHEIAESLEQLRALYYGLKVHVTIAQTGPERGVDTEADLEYVERQILEASSRSSV